MSYNISYVNYYGNRQVKSNMISFFLKPIRRCLQLIIRNPYKLLFVVFPQVTMRKVGDCVNILKGRVYKNHSLHSVVHIAPRKLISFHSYFLLVKILVDSFLLMHDFNII